MKTFFPLLLLAMNVLFFQACQSSSSGEDSGTSDWNEYSTGVFSIRYPKTWKLNEQPQEGVSFNILAPLDTEKDDFRENINLISQDLSAKPTTLNELIALSEQQIKGMGTNAELLRSERIKQGRNEYHLLYYHFNQGNFQMALEQHIWVRKNTSYILTFTSEAEAYVQYREVSQKILNAFRFK